jgi:hypothetical protein
MLQYDRDSEKRDFIRMEINAKITLKAEGQTFAAVCRDLSSTGFQVDAPTHLDTGAVVQVHLPSNHPTLDDFDATARVIWTKTSDTGGQLLGLVIDKKN